jgi:hypothetical protein
VPPRFGVCAMADADATTATTARAVENNDILSFICSSLMMVRYAEFFEFVT